MHCFYCPAVVMKLVYYLVIFSSLKILMLAVYKIFHAYISYFSVGLIQYYDLLKKDSKKLRVHILNLKHKEERTEWK